MKFADLRPGRVRDWLAANRGGDLWVFQHIPKTAGSSLAAELAVNRPPYRNIHVGGADPALQPEEQRTAAVDRFLADFATRPFRSASGHLRHWSVDAILAAHPAARLFTFVREPVERVVSEYFYCLSPEHNDPEGFARAFPTLRDFATARESSNKMALYIGGSRKGDAAGAVQAAFERFEFIGSQRLYPLSFRILSSLLWFETKPEARLRVSGRDNRPKEIDPDIVRLIRANNATDAAIFAAVSEVYRLCRDELNVELRRHAEERRAARAAG